ncbi:MAG: SDR family oxidoreductase [Armatimonadota bacterium]|jgi:dTDP-4-dehydrorhamnose reductase
MRILVLGGEGMLGHKMYQVLRARFDHVACTVRGRREDEFYREIGLFQNGNLVEGLDATQTSGVREILEEQRPDVMVNCIGIIKQRDEAKQPIPSIALNALLPHLLADVCRPWRGRLIHFSTDCVFSGKQGSYTEGDPPDAEDLYGRTKSLGEVTCGNALTLRTSMIGRELQCFQSLLEWFLGQEHTTVRGFTRAVYSGLTTNQLADVVTMLIRHYPSLSGLYHVVGEAISKHDLLCLVRDVYGLDIEIVPDDSVICDRSMVGDSFCRATDYVSPAWPDLVAQMAADPTPYDEWR